MADILLRIILAGMQILVLAIPVVFVVLFYLLAGRLVMLVSFAKLNTYFVPFAIVFIVAISAIYFLIYRKYHSFQEMEAFGAVLFAFVFLLAVWNLISQWAVAREAIRYADKGKVIDSVPIYKDVEWLSRRNKYVWEWACYRRAIQIKDVLAAIDGTGGAG